ncbi:hypothetical protein [Legionella waltersii]|uniref:Uncharacterized protein n=1 Tax=Legionella waltersii TaxID=66969 RepID=A0A0W1AD38_9GAMM|nr:hypothetical protein [Legionella waltersii]KTD79233.1 hypothetical protein Lwal_1305 [Legionella waltersii]SNV12650.1 Uncharacterised protein [Legionella waltersii]
MKYVVTHCTFDGEAGGNPLWHSCILFSKMDEEKKMLEVVDTWGFYGLPTTNPSNSYLNQLKKKIGLDVDLTGNHGWLRHEDARYLDLGCGLHGTSFELTEDSFKQLRQECLKMVSDQEQAVKEVVESQGIKGKEQGKERIYSHEQFSNLIYKIELIKAEQQKREPRLKPFELRMSLGWTGPSLSCSSTCKTQSISLLSKVLSKEQIDRLTEEGKHPSVPRFSGQDERIYLHSTGPVREHKKASGDVVYYRDFKDPDVKLYWTVPPQEIETLSDETLNLLGVDSEHCDEVKGLVRKLQRSEWLIRNTKLPEKYQSYQKALIEQIVLTYREFSTIEPKKPEPKVSGWYGYALSLFSAPRNEEEKKLFIKIRNAKMLLNSLYMAMVDDWKINDKLPMEPAVYKSYKASSEEQKGLSESQETPIDLANPIESVVCYMSTKDKINLCQILGRRYVEPVSEDDDECEESLPVGMEPSM